MRRERAKIRFPVEGSAAPAKEGFPFNPMSGWRSEIVDVESCTATGPVEASPKGADVSGLASDESLVVGWRPQDVTATHKHNSGTLNRTRPFLHDPDSLGKFDHPTRALSGSQSSVPE